MDTGVVLYLIGLMIFMLLAYFGWGVNRFCRPGVIHISIGVLSGISIASLVCSFDRMAGVSSMPATKRAVDMASASVAVLLRIVTPAIPCTG